jgi:hypothetical protein
MKAETVKVTVLLTLSLATCALSALTACAAAGDGSNSIDPQYPEATLTSRELKATLYLPDAQQGYYRGTRFDWSGLVSRVDWGGHRFFSEFKQEHDPFNHDDIAGMAEEFGIEAAPSFAQAKAGEPFIKIGIGVLERPDDAAYQFHRRYKVLKPGDWKVTREPGRIEFQQSLVGPKGWAYKFRKVIVMSPGAPTIKVTRRLTNTGTETINTDHYGHNFLRIDNIPVLTNYSLEFPFEPRLGPEAKTQGGVELRGHSLVFTKDLAPNQAIWVRLEGYQKVTDNEIKVVNHLTGASMTITGDQPLSKLVFYSSGGVLSPEPFVKIALSPGETKEWSTTYRFAIEKH